jgi:deoxyribodipyrimidine photolyase
MAIDGTSRLSPYLRFGLISPRQVAATVGRFEFEDDPEGLAAWREGRTGYPLVDAGMRQLTGQVAGSGTDAAPLLPDLQPRHPGGETRPRRRLHPPLGPRAVKARPTGHLRPLAGRSRRPGEAGVRLGSDYPHPIVDHMTARYQEASPRRS